MFIDLIYVCENKKFYPHVELPLLMLKYEVFPLSTSTTLLAMQ